MRFTRSSTSSDGDLTRSAAAASDESSLAVAHKPAAAAAHALRIVEWQG
jgi:hypothetical protein